MLNIIPNIDASELETIQQYMSCFLGDDIPTDVVDEFDFALDMLLEMQNIGLVNFVYAPDAVKIIRKSYPISRNENTIDFKGGQFVFSEINDSFEISFDSNLLQRKDKSFTVLWKFL